MRKLKRIVQWLVVVGVLIGLSGAGGYVSQTKNKALRLISSRVSAISSKSPKPVKTLPTVVNGMNQAIQTEDSGVESAATLIDLDNNQTYNAGESSTVFKAASTLKVLAAVDYLHQVEEGNATLDQSIGGTTAQQQIEQMIEVSDNTAWANLNDFLGSQQASYASSIRLSSYSGGEDNTITTADEASLLAQLYQGKLINAQHQALLYNFMANTDSTDLIPAALPSNATVYHKYGELWGNLHDAAIVSYGGHHFVLVIYTKNDDGTTGDYSGQVDLIHAITKAASSDITAN